MSAEELSRTVELFTRQVAHWQPPRWAAPVPAGTATRAEAVHHLVQEIADLAAAAEGEPRRQVPRLENDLALPDQLRVVAADLIAAEAPDPVMSAAATKINATRHAL